MRVWLLAAVALVCGGVKAAPVSDLSYLPKDVNYDPSVPKPADVLGYPVGTWHVRHDQLVNYMYRLAESSDRVSIVETGRTHEHRPLLQLRFSKPASQAKLDELRLAHLRRLNGSSADADAPLILWMGYSVHGDEASGANASLLFAYYLAAAQGPSIDALYDNTIVLLDPSINPDGLSRFAQWANMHKGRELVADQEHREHNQGWPSGRTNHYWFDLNRDWLLLTHPESHAKIDQFHLWRPHVLTDFHEMGTNSTYFFQPGIPSRRNPNTLARNAELTAELGKFHAAAFDSKKQLYFTEEAFDDFYYGKGSTYPDAFGTIGILFEQASARGHVQESINGDLHFTQAISNQLTTSLSTLAGAMANRDALIAFQQTHGQTQRELAAKDKVKAVLIDGSSDPQRLADMAGILAAHRIATRGLAKTSQVGEREFKAGSSLYVSFEQSQYGLIKSLFSNRTSFDDNTFYDVSSWNIAHAFNFPYRSLGSSERRRLSLTDSFAGAVPELPTLLEDSPAFAFSWTSEHAPQMVQRLLNANVALRTSGKSMTASTASGNALMQAGTVIIPMGLDQPNDAAATIAALSQELQVPVFSVTSGLTQQGVDLGSRQVAPITQGRVLLVGGEGMSQYEVGEIWHYLDTELHLPVTIVDRGRLNRIDLNSYTHMIWAGGQYTGLSEALVNTLSDWVRGGGAMIGQTAATRWFSENEWLKTSFISAEEIDKAFETKGLSYADKESLAAKKRIAGAVFEANIDLSHPLMFGIAESPMTLFKNHSNVMFKSDTPFANAATYSKQPLRSGYASTEMVNLIEQTAAVVAHRFGRGKVIGFADNLNFRGYWRGSRRLLANALYQSQHIN